MLIAKFLLINYSIWEDAESLRSYVYSGAHRDVLRRRLEWFERMEEQHIVLFWVPAGEIPTPETAVERLMHLRAHGPTPDAFTFRETFPPPVTAAS